MVERQRHGFNFERWVRREFYGESYGGKWNKTPKATGPYPDLSKSIKTAKWGSPVYFGDAIRQFQVGEDFLLIVAFWACDSRGKRKWVNVTDARVRLDLWTSLWGNTSIGQLQQLDAIIKDRNLSVTEVRQAAHSLKRRILAESQSIMRLHPKIDTKGQRRLQCSLRFDDFFQLIARTEPEISEKPQLWGKELTARFD